jgi:PadR family transcriptional regulator, regulatory protein AphA
MNNAPNESICQEDLSTISTTSAALLGQLALRQQSPYEMTREMQRNLRYFWPRAASHVYREVKRLTADGLATAERRSTGLRHRTVYSITEQGRRALTDWLASQPAGTSLEHEPLLRVFLASSGTREDLLGALARARTDAEQMLAVGRPLAGEYLSATHPFQDQLHIRGLTFDYLYNWARFTVDWADRAEREVRRWDDLAPTPDKHERALKHLSQIIGQP